MKKLLLVLLFVALSSDAQAQHLRHRLFADRVNDQCLTLLALMVARAPAVNKAGVGPWITATCDQSNRPNLIADTFAVDYLQALEHMINMAIPQPPVDP